MNLTDFAALIGFVCGLIVGGVIVFLTFSFVWCF